MGEPMADQSAVGIGLVGAGAFGEFCLAAFAEMSEVRIVAVADTDLARAQNAAGHYQAVAYPTLDALLADPQVQIVALNTPPFLHGAQGLAVLNAGKHLFCEKPLALTIHDGEQLIRTAQEKHRYLTVDYVMRYNPYWAMAADLARSGVLGALRHMDLANHANGLALPTDHWFWDQPKSGGIWIEHGVHFFDAFSWVAGAPGELLSAAAYRRGDGRIDRVEGLFRYGQVAAHCYHAFDQSGQTEQTTVRLTFEHGYVTLSEWMPTELRLQTTLPRASWERFISPITEYSEQSGGQRLATSRTIFDKSAIYRRAIQAGMRDLAAAVQSDQPLKVSGAHGLASLATAVAATNGSA